MRGAILIRQDLLYPTPQPWDGSLWFIVIRTAQFIHCLISASDGNNNRAAERSANYLWTRDFEKKKHQHQTEDLSIV